MWLAGSERSLQSPLYKTENTSCVYGRMGGRLPGLLVVFAVCHQTRPKAPPFASVELGLGPVSRLLEGNLAPFPTCLLCPFSRAPGYFSNCLFLQQHFPARPLRPASPPLLLSLTRSPSFLL